MIVMSSSTIQDIIDEFPSYFLYVIYTGFIGIEFFFYMTQNALVPIFTMKEFQQRVSKLSEEEQVSFYVIIPSMIHSIVHSVFHNPSLFFGYSEPHNYERTIYLDEKWLALFHGIFDGYLLGDLLVVLGPNIFGFFLLRPSYICIKSMDIFDVLSINAILWFNNAVL